MSKETATTAVRHDLQQQPPQRCSCEATAPADDSRLPWDYSILCSACCKFALRPHVERHEQALMARDVAREECAQRLARLSCTDHQNDQNTNEEGVGSTTTSHFSELQFESQRLRDRRAQLNQQCASMAVEVAAHAVENEERQGSLDPQSELQRQHLRRLEQSVSEGSMKQAIENARNQVRILRFQWALQAFAMHRLDVRPEDACSTKESCASTSSGTPEEQSRRRSLRSKEGRQKQARGIGKIGGLPLPHAGPELYGVLPPQELQSALRLVASISNTVARCLGILLPHPVLLQFSGASNQLGDIIHFALPTAARTMRKQGSRTSNGNGDTSDPTSTSSLLDLLGGTLDSDNNGSQAGGRQGTIERSANATVVPPSMDPALVSQRLRHAMSAVMADSSSTTGTQYALAAEVLHDDEFAIALQLLQNNVIALCIRAGVPVAKLWPAEAVLLNLYALQVFCEDQVKEHLK